MSAISANAFMPACAQILLIICCWYETAVFQNQLQTAKKHSESVKNQRVLKIKDLCLVGHSKLWLVIRL